MGASSYSKNKENIYLWRQKNYENYRLSQNTYQLKYQKRKNEWRKISKVFFNILNV